MPATMTTVDSILKEIYGPRIEDQLQDEVVGVKRIERSSDGVTETAGGKYVDFPIRVGRNHGIGYRHENEKLPNADHQKYSEVHVPLRYGYGRVRLTGQVMTLAKTNPQAFASAMDREMDGLKDDLVKDSNRIFYGDSTGLIAKLDGTETGTNPKSVESTQYLEVGMRVDVIDTTDGSVEQADTVITDVNADDNEVTFKDGFDASSDLGIYRQGSYNREPSGLSNIVDDEKELHGLDPAVQSVWKATVNDNDGSDRSLSESLMIKMVDDIRVKGGRTSLILTSLGVRRAYFNLLTQQRRYTDTKNFDGGYVGLAFNHGREIPVVEDVDHLPGTMHFLDEKKYKIYRNKPWHWMDDDGTTLKWVTDYDAWEGVMRQYSEIGVEQRNAQGVLKDITEG